MENLMAFAGLPLAFFVTASGLGLLVDRVSRAQLPNELLAPVGFCTAVSLLLAVFKLGGHVEVAVAVLVAGTLAGFMLARTQLRRVVDVGPAGLAALAVYLLYILPMIGTGGWTWLGYNFVNDTAVQFLLVDHLKAAGTAAGTLPQTTGGQSIGTFLESGYPLGTHAYAAGLSGLLGQGIDVLYQSYLACMAAMAAMALAALGRGLAGARTAAVVAAVAVGSNLTLHYALQGNIKEIGVLAAVSAGSAVGLQLARASGSPLPLAGVLGLCLAAILSTYNAAGLPYLGAVGGALGVVLLLVHRRAALQRRFLVAGALTLGVAGIAAAAAISTMRQFYDVASNVVSTTAAGGESFGALQHRPPLLQSSGIWLDGRYFEPIEPYTSRYDLTQWGSWLVVALLVVAAVEIYRRRRPEALLVLVPVALTAALVAPRVGAYADGKLLAVMSPAVLFTAGIGVVGLWSWRYARPVALAAGAAVVVAIGVSDSFAYHDVKPAPQERMEAIEDVVARTPGTGTILYNEFEEFAKYYDPDDRVNVGPESITPRQVQLRVDAPIYGNSFDLDQQKLDYVQGFGFIVLRRSPAASRPPAGYRRVYENRYYESWARRPGAPAVLAHLPLTSGPSSATAVPSCADVRALGRRARRQGEGARLVASVPPPTARFDVVDAPLLSSGWPPDATAPGTVTVAGPGQARGPVSIPVAGEYDVWLRGDLPRAVDVEVDGRRIGEGQGVNTPRGWLPIASTRLAAGRHLVRISAGGGTLETGTGAIGLVGAVAFVRRAPARLLTVSPGDAASLCGRRLDWIEVVRGR